MRRAGRLFQIVHYIQQRRVTTAEQIAEELGVSVRTVYRDIQELVASGVPIQGEAGVGYMLPHHFTLPPLTFDHEELEALLLGIRMVRSWSDADLVQAANAVLRKLQAVLPENVDQLSYPMLFAPDFIVSKEMTSHLPSLRRAIRNKHKLTLGYERRDGAQSQRMVWPLALFFWGSSWSLLTWCELRQDFRNFRIDRIHALTVEEEHYPVEEGKTFEDFQKTIPSRRD